MKFPCLSMGATWNMAISMPDGLLIQYFGSSENSMGIYQQRPFLDIRRSNPLKCADANFT